jgi:hypothetical protein
MRVIVRIKPILLKEIKDYCKVHEITVSEFLRNAAKMVLKKMG